MSKNKELLMDAAMDLFCKKGYSNVTVGEILQQTGLSNGTFYHYFKRKEDLLLEIYNAHPIPFSLENNIEKKALTPFESMREYYLDFARYWDGLGRQFASDMFHGRMTEFGDIAYAEMHGIGTLRRFIMKAQECGTISKSVSAENISKYIDFFIRGLIVEWMIQRDRRSLTEMVEEYVFPALKAFLTPGE